MRETDVAGVRVSGGFSSRRLLYRALAQALAGAEPPAGVAYETTFAGPPPRIGVRPAHLLGSPGIVVLPGVRATVGGFSRAPAEPPIRSRERFGILQPLGSEPPARVAPPSFPPAHPALSWCRAVGGWAAIQVLWSHSGDGRIFVAVRFRIAARDRECADRLFDVVSARLLADWVRGTGIPATIGAAGSGARRDWGRTGIRTIPRRAWTPLPPHLLERTPEVGFQDLESSVSAPEGHTVVFGASGTGKTTHLADRAVRAIAGGRTAVVLDLHGDLAPAVLASLPPTRREWVVAVDAGVRPVAGIAGLVSAGPSVDRAAAHFVAAVKRLSPDGADLAWGFRLERIFDTFSRLVLESGGTLLDLYALLTDARRREAALLETHRPATARFLEELGPIVRRNPEFLWSAATRLSKVVLVPELAELLAPPDGGLEVERLVGEGRSVLIRLPVATLGPEAAGFAATLVLGRLYLGLVGRASHDSARMPVLLVLDEVQGFPPRLVSEILSDSRKFGLEAIVATQYPDRLSPELRAAAAGAAATFIAFRTPSASAAQVGSWLGIPAAAGPELLASLPTGVAVVLDPHSGSPRWLPAAVPTCEPGGRSWADGVARTRAEFGVLSTGPSTGPEEESVERVLLAVLAAEERGSPLAPASVVPAAARLAGAPVDAAELERAWARLERGPECATAPGAVRLTSAGEQRVGLGTSTGAVSESAEHRALLLRAFRVFARKGHAIEILRQGRFDTTLPDALFRQLGSTPRTVPADVARTLDSVRGGWAWRCFSGRDVHLEAEVSGALRPERIRRGWSKAKARGAFALFLVGDARRARRIRATLLDLGLGPDQAQVWTLGPTTNARARGAGTAPSEQPGVSPPEE
ncbi:MAG: hypothetical protein L3K02_01720 [Thermoplasmata archaeon]|nr:hypothetical protein [Thermoplasmata archaeon]